MANHRGVKLRKAKGQYTENRTANVQMSQTIFTDLYTQSHTFRFFSVSSSISIAVAGTPTLFNCSTWSFSMALRAIHDREDGAGFSIRRPYSWKELKDLTLSETSGKDCKVIFH